MSTLMERLNDPAHCFVIAEIGSNHDGDFDTVLRLMDAATGADGVKFQSFLADHLVTRDSPDYALLKKIELAHDWYPRLKVAAEERGLVFFSTATNSVTMGWLEEIDVALYKIASPNLTHIPLIREVAALGKPVILSTGLSGAAEIQEAVDAFTASGNRQFALMHCVSCYPTPPAAVNLRAMETLRQLFPGVPVGYSDHTTDIATPVAAVALGARLIEKHLTWDRAAPGPDHHYALEPEEFATMVRHIRIAEQVAGTPELVVTRDERQLRQRYWRSLHAVRDLPAGAVLGAADVSVVRPFDGLHSRHLGDVIGMRLARPLAAGAALTWDAFKPENA